MTRNVGRGAGAALVAVLAALLAITLVPGAAQAHPSNPTDGQIGKARHDKSARARDVGRLQAEVAKATGDMTRLQDSAELAAEQYNKAVTDYQDARRKAAAAKAAVTRARAQVRTAQAKVGQFARGSYMYGSTLNSSALALLGSNGPKDLTEGSGLLQAAGAHQLQALNAVQTASVRRANAESAARSAVRAMAAAKSRAATAKRIAAAKVAAARSRMAALQAHKTELEGELVQAKARLSGLLSARQAYLTWKAAELAAARKRAAALARARALAAERAKELASQRQNDGSDGTDGSGGSGGSGGGGAPAPPPVSGGGWSSSAGQQVVAAAERWLGTPYAWSGGTPSGPSYGTTPDEGVLGFDCSGLALYAWAQQGVSLPHYSGYQYTSGSHPSMSNLAPGDLLFWSYDGSPGTIHHVAIYIGGGQVIEAPESGDVIKIVPIWYDGLVGATRPGT